MNHLQGYSKSKTSETTLQNLFGLFSFISGFKQLYILVSFTFKYKYIPSIEWQVLINNGTLQTFI